MTPEVASRFTLFPAGESESVLEHALCLERQGCSVILIHAPVFERDTSCDDADSAAWSERPIKLKSPSCTCGRKDCSAIGKHPIDRGWQTGAPLDENGLRDRFARCKFVPNLGMVLGPQASGMYLVAVDIDDAARMSVLEEQLGPLPPTATSTSARGGKRLYRLPAGTPESRIRNVTGLGGSRGVDVKAARGQIVIPPSMHASGVHYRWTRWGEIAELPAAWVLALLGPAPRPTWAAEYTPTLLKDDRRSRNRAEKYLQSAVLAESGLVARCGEGLRNSTLHASLCRLLPLAHGLGLPSGHGYVTRELSSAAGHAGLVEREIRSTVASAERWLRESGAVRVLPHEPTLVNGNGSNGVSSSPPPPRLSPSEYRTDPHIGPVSDETGMHPIVPSGDASLPSSAFPPPSVSSFFSSFPPASAEIDLLQDNNSPAKCAENVARLLARHPDWGGGPARNGLTGRLYWPGKLPRPLEGLSRTNSDVSDVDELEIQGWLLAQPFEHRVKVSSETIHAGVLLAGHRHAVDPLVQRLDALPAWDGVPRLGGAGGELIPIPYGSTRSSGAIGWLTTLAGVPDSPVTRLFGRRWLLSAVARAYQPGCVADGVLILVGDQGIGKNRLLTTLFGDAPYVESLGSYRLGHDVEADQLAGAAWIVHDDEMGGRRSDLDALKAWVSRREDTYRPKYGRNLVTAPRRAVLVCSTNRATFLEDETNRRFWPVQCGAIDIPKAELERDQLFAEAIVAYRGIPPAHPLAASLGVRTQETWTIGPQDDLWAEITEVQDSRRCVDAIEEDVRLTLLRLGSPSRLTVSELSAALSIPPERRDNALEQRLGRALRCLGYTRGRTMTQGSRIYAYSKEN